MIFDFTALEKILATLIISFLTTALILPKIKLLGEYLKLVDIPNKRKQKQNPIVSIGGIAIFLGFILAILLILYLGKAYVDLNYSSSIIIILLLGSSAFFLLGLVDDILSLSPYIRLIIQIALALIISNLGICFDKVDLAWLDAEPLYLPKTLSILITTFWIVGVTNAINWIDGLDGLAAGVTGFAAMGLATISFQNGQYLEPLIAAGISGSSFGFLRLNFYPAKIIMGDSGSYFLGFILSSVFVLSTSSKINPIGIFTPILLLIIPLLDMVKVILNRLTKRLSPFLADRSHLHHELINYGFSELGTVILIYSFSQWLTIFSIGLSSSNNGLYIVMTMISSFMLFFGFIIARYVL